MLFVKTVADSLPEGDKYAGIESRVSESRVHW